MNIYEIAKAQIEKGKDENSLKPLLQKNWEALRETLATISLIYASDLEHQISEWAKKNKITSGDISITKKVTSFNDFAYYGFWHIESKYLGSSDSIINEELQVIFDYIVRYDYRFDTNENFIADKEYIFSMTELSKIYDALVPQETLNKYRASLLELELSRKEKSDESNLKKI